MAFLIFFLCIHASLLLPWLNAVLLDIQCVTNRRGEHRRRKAMEIWKQYKKPTSFLCLSLLYLVFVTGRGGAGFHLPDAAVIGGRGEYF